MHVLKTIFSEWDTGRRTILATVIKTKGSTYRKTGAQIIVNNEGERDGQLSGGCAENNIVERCLHLLVNEQAYDIAEYLNYSAPDDLFGFDKGCRGDLTVLLEATDWMQTFRIDLDHALEENLVIRTLTLLHCEQQPELRGRRLLQIDGQTRYLDPGLLKWDSCLVELLSRHSGCGLIEDEANGLQVYIHEFPRLKKMILVGAGGDAVPVMELCSQVGYRVHVVESRPNRLTKLQARGNIVTHLVRKNVDSIRQILLEFPPVTPIVLMSHNLELDSLALQAALQAEMQFVGVLGPKHRTVRLLQETNSVWSPAICCPIGLDIGAATPEEIAVSIVGQLISLHSGRRFGKQEAFTNKA